MDKLMAMRESYIGQRRMRAIEHPQLRSLVGRHATHPLCPSGFPARPRTGETIFDDPLPERLGGHGRPPQPPTDPPPPRIATAVFPAVAHYSPDCRSSTK